MGIQHNFDLTGYNTFGVRAYAEYFFEFKDVNALRECVQQSDFKHILVLGGGSNVLFTGNVAGLVLKNNITGIEIIEKDDSQIMIRIGAGENWSNLVRYCVEKGWGGVENLSLIPGSVGAAPVQNIGAYGVELKDVFYELEAFHLREHYIRKFRNDECHFGYRDSVFKNELKGKFVILNVTLRLPQKTVTNISYGSIAKQLEVMRVDIPTIQSVASAVIAIRQSKLPDPSQLGNAGSFFKNPVVSVAQFEKLEEEYPDIPHYPFGEYIKIPAGWLIEKCGFKGVRKGNVGCYEKQSLVIVNYGGATGKEILRFSADIIRAVEEKFGIKIDREVNVIPIGQT